MTTKEITPTVLMETAKKFDLNILKEDLHTIFYKYACCNDCSQHESRNSCFDSYLEIREILIQLAESV